jgi:hypothetical protein
MELIMALEKTDAALANLKAVIAAKLQADEAEIAQLQQEVTDADIATAADIDALSASLQPAPAADPNQPPA